MFQEFSTDITLPAGKKIAFMGLMRIEEKALLKLEDEKVLELHRKGFMAWIYAHLFSLSNFRPLAQIIAKAEEADKEEVVAEE